MTSEMELLSKKEKEESQAIVVSNPSGISQELDLHTSFVPLNSDLDSSTEGHSTHQQLTTIECGTSIYDWVSDIQ